jgi:hypothetical protein
LPAHLSISVLSGHRPADLVVPNIGSVFGTESLLIFARQHETQRFIHSWFADSTTLAPGFYRDNKLCSGVYHKAYQSPWLHFLRVLIVWGCGDLVAQFSGKSFISDHSCAVFTLKPNLLQFSSQEFRWEDVIVHNSSNNCGPTISNLFSFEASFRLIRILNSKGSGDFFGPTKSDLHHTN